MNRRLHTTVAALVPALVVLGLQISSGATAGAAVPVAPKAPTTSLVNGDFESPAIAKATYSQVLTTTMPTALGSRDTRNGCR